MASGRAALSREDWETAAEAANKAREGFTLMTQDEFTAGFCNANDEWIYGGYASSEENMWYYFWCLLCIQRGTFGQ